MTDTPDVIISRAPTNKAVAATGASAFGAALATLVIAGFEHGGAKLAPEVATAITTIVTVIVTAIAAYFVPPSAGESVVMTASGPKTGKPAPATSMVVPAPNA